VDRRLGRLRRRGRGGRPGRFEREWTALRAYAAERGVRLIGDVPIYVAPGSADHVAHPELFQPGAVSGAPPDAYSELGQLWANPLYDWGAMRRRRYRWWVERFRARSRCSTWRASTTSAASSRTGRSPRTPTTRARDAGCAGPGRAPFDAAARELSVDGAALPFIAEDLGVITPPVERPARRPRPARDGRPAVRLRPRRSAQPAQARPPREQRVVYTARTTTTPCAAGTRARATPCGPRSTPTSPPTTSPSDDVSWALIRLAFASRARLAMVQLQDVLGLGSEGG
jgi:4-alpha-glucanotransferase